MGPLLVTRIRRDIAHYGLWPAGGRVLAALSGGSDSVALLFLLRELATTHDVVLAGAAHLNHGLRRDARSDAEFCRALCDRLGVPFVAGAADIGRLAAEWRCSIEAAARRERYTFLESARHSLQADRIAVAHTADDQAETVLLRLLRGAGTRGLRGILPVNGTVTRPLLRCRRADLRAYLDGLDEPWVEDVTNADLSVPRNRVRHELLPLLAARYQPAVTRVLARTAEVASDDDALLEAMAADAAVMAVDRGAAGLALKPAALAVLPRPLARRVVRRALESAGPTRGVEFDDINRVLEVCHQGGPRAAEAAGLRVERFSASAVLLIRTPAPLPPGLPVRSLMVPGEVDLPEIGTECRLRAERPIEWRGPVAGGWQVALHADVPVPLVVRSRRPGDRMRPAGLGGSKKVQDLLVDRKVARRRRDLVPIVADATGRIVWVAGHAADEAAQAPAAASDVIVLTFEPPVVPGSEGK